MSAMDDQTITLGLDGEVSLGDYAAALANLRDLIAALTSEVVGRKSGISWIIDSLDGGSAITSLAAHGGDPVAVSRVVTAYDTVGRALEARQTIPYSTKVVTPANKLTGILNGHIPSMSFSSKQLTSVVVSAPSQADPAPRTRTSIGAITGTVETLARRSGLKFTLYDHVFDKAVTCYLQPDQEDLIREYWGCLVRVVGEISREPIKGRPIAVRKIKSVEESPESPRGSLLGAHRIIRFPPQDGLPEEMIRRVRSDV